MPDKMFFSIDACSLVKGQRRDQRTPTKRLAVFRTVNGDQKMHHGVVLDLNAYGLRVRSAIRLPVGIQIEIHLRRNGIGPNLSKRLRGRIARTERVANQQFDLGVELEISAIELPQVERIEIPVRRTSPPQPASRMHIVDFVVGGQ